MGEGKRKMGEMEREKLRNWERGEGNSVEDADTEYRTLLIFSITDPALLTKTKMCS
jgi:hypothetical protein